MKPFLLMYLLVCADCFCQLPQKDTNLLYARFARAYEELNADAVSNLYAADAKLLNLYASANPNSISGRSSIYNYYAAFFERFRRSNQKLSLTFKILGRKSGDASVMDNGYYQLEVISPNKPSVFSYGKFSTVLKAQDSGWVFTTDATTNAEFPEYENIAAAAIPQRQELLYGPYYDELLGDYINDQNQLIVIGRSQTRLYAFFEHAHEYRGLNKVNATTWTLGNTILSEKTVQTYQFKNGKILIYENDMLKTTAVRKEIYKSESVSYKNEKGIKLSGTLFLPNKANGKAMVLVHGSGPQDRNGYASIIRLLADNFARKGVTVLTYDKQGVGGSEGNSDYESFADLAMDAVAGINFLRTRKDLGPLKIGLGGSSQAGWIIAKAIENSSAKVDFALTIGAAGSGISVVDQNLYNTEIMMRCSKTFSPAQISNAITQQKHFFRYLADRSHAKTLDRFTKSIKADTMIKDWLFPTSGQVDLSNRNQWFTALEVQYNPLPVWKNCKIPVFMLFSEFDDSTPAMVVKTKVDNLKNKNIQTYLLKNAQHIGLETNSVCRNDLSELNKFHNEFFKSMDHWLQSF